jgi:hypothetical protein
MQRSLSIYRHPLQPRRVGGYYDKLKYTRYYNLRTTGNPNHTHLRPPTVHPFALLRPSWVQLCMDVQFNSVTPQEMMTHSCFPIIISRGHDYGDTQSDPGCVEIHCQSVVSTTKRTKADLPSPADPQSFVVSLVGPLHLLAAVFLSNSR